MYAETQSNIRIGVCSCGCQVMNPPKSHRVVVCPNCICIAKHGVGLIEYHKRLRNEQKAKSLLKNEINAFKFNCDNKAKGNLKCEQQCDFCKHKYRSLLTPIPKLSKKQSAKNKAIKQAKLAVLEHAIENDSLFCQGCGSATALTFSHNIGVAQSQALAANSENIDIMCLQCHSDWESNIFERLVKLRNFLELLKFQYLNDNEKFEKKLTVLLNNSGNPIAQKLLNKIEKW